MIRFNLGCLELGDAGNESPVLVSGLGVLHHGLDPGERLLQPSLGLLPAHLQEIVLVFLGGAGGLMTLSLRLVSLEKAFGPESAEAAPLAPPPEDDFLDDADGPDDLPVLFPHLVTTHMSLIQQ